MVLADIPINARGRLADGTLFSVPDNPLNRLEDYHVRVITLYPGSPSAHDRRYPAATPCRKSK